MVVWSHMWTVFTSGPATDHLCDLRQTASPLNPSVSLPRKWGNNCLPPGDAVSTVTENK